MVEGPSYNFDHSGCGDVGPYVGPGSVPGYLPGVDTDFQGVLNVLNPDGSTEA